MAEVQWKIYWGEYSFETYLYGSEIFIHSKEDVEFINELMPPGTVIKKWYSKTNFQLKKVEPTLPLICGENRYHISIDIDTGTERGVLFEIIFYDRYEREAGSVIIRDREMDFRCPLKTYSYEIRMIAAGAKDFHFHCFTLKEFSDEVR